MRDFINELSEILNNEQKELIEIDLILSSILFELSQNKFFSNNFLLKGGTCLIKCYLDYYRFSEDLDFTFKNQELFRSKSKKNDGNPLEQTSPRYEHSILVVDFLTRNGLSNDVRSI